MNREFLEYKQAGDALRIKMFSSVAHDLKTPLACIIGSLQMLNQVNEKLSPTQRDMLIHMALAQAHQLDDVVAAILNSVKCK